MKKNNLILILIMIVLIGLLIFFLPDIYNKVQELEANNIELPKNKKNKEEEKKETITMESDIVKNLTYPIMRNDKSKTDSYYQLDSVEITKFSNNDILYNAFLDIYDGYLVDHNNVGCSNNSKEFDATYLSSRIKNIIGRNTEYTLEDFTVPNINKNSEYIGLWKYNQNNNTYVFYGDCNKNNNEIIYYDYEKIYKLDTSKDNNFLYLYYYVGFMKINSNNYVLYSDPNFTDQISSGSIDNMDNINNLKLDTSKLKTYMYTFKKGICTYDNYCFYRGEWIND